MPEEDGSAPVGYGYIDRNLARVREEIAAACREAGRDPSGVTLLAAIKSADVGRLTTCIGIAACALSERTASNS